MAEEKVFQVFTGGMKNVTILCVTVLLHFSLSLKTPAAASIRANASKF
jgi:hypothetical protein